MGHGRVVGETVRVVFDPAHTALDPHPILLPLFLPLLGRYGDSAVCVRGAVVAQRGRIQLRDVLVVVVVVVAIIVGVIVGVAIRVVVMLLVIVISIVVAVERAVADAMVSGRCVCCICRVSSCGGAVIVAAAGGDRSGLGSGQGIRGGPVAILAAAVVFVFVVVVAVVTLPQGAQLKGDNTTPTSSSTTSTAAPNADAIVILLLLLKLLMIRVRIPRMQGVLNTPPTATTTTTP